MAFLLSRPGRIPECPDLIQHLVVLKSQFSITLVGFSVMNPSDMPYHLTNIREYMTANLTFCRIRPFGRTQVRMNLPDMAITKIIRLEFEIAKWALFHIAPAPCLSS